MRPAWPPSADGASDVVGGEDDQCEGEEVDERLSKQTTKHHELLSVADVSKPGFPTARCCRNSYFVLLSGSGHGVYQIGEV